MLTQVQHIEGQHIVDNDAVVIGELYGKARTAVVNGMRYAVEAGELLIRKKKGMKHGQWLPWLEENAAVLEFEAPSTAGRLMKAARKHGAILCVDAQFDETEAIRISREVWDNPVRGTGGTGENEWYTPPEYLERARRVLGAFDLDPASSTQAQATVQASAHFTKDDDGLAKEWHGRVWLNPPYAQPFIAHFAAKMIAEREAGRVTAAIMLTHNYSDTTWFQDLAAVADAICFTRGRVRFLDASGEIAAPTQGQAFFYFGDRTSPGGIGRASQYYRAAEFAVAFSEIGFVALPIAGDGWERSP